MKNFSKETFGNAAIVGLWAVTGPLIVAVTVARSGGLTDADLNSWIFAGFGLAGLVSIGFSAWFRQPIVIPFSLPAAVFAGTALEHLSLAELIGAYIMTGVAVLLLAVTGWVHRVMSAIPLPVVMGMVAGVFLPFVKRIAAGFDIIPWVAVTAVGSFVVASCLPRVARVVPPLLAALVLGAGAVFVLDGFDINQPPTIAIAEPVIYAPAFTIKAFTELVLPLTIIVLAIGNAPSFAILKNVGYDVPHSAITAGCGIGSIAFGIMGAPPLCNPGIITGMLNRSGPVDQRFLGGMALGLFLFLMGVFAPVFIGIGLAMPAAFVGILAGLALFSVLQNAFVAAFESSVPVGAMVAFLVTVSDVAFLNIGAPFWGLVLGCAATLIIENGRNSASVAREPP